MIGSKQICTQCNQGNVPIDGVCKQKDNEAVTAADCKKSEGTGLAESDKVCGKCGAGYFLYKGGCYKIGGEVGSLICADTSSPGVRATAGVCEDCKSGYFKNPEAAANADSCISCGDQAGFTITGGSGNTYKGVQNCATCQAPAGPGAVRATHTAVCESCQEGFLVDNNGAACTQCSDNTNCAKCDAGADKCTKCKATATNKYFKDSGDGTGTCVNEGGCNDNTHFTDDAEDPTHGKMCRKCSEGIADCKTCAPPSPAALTTTSTIVCTECTTATNKPNVAGTGCFTCSIDGCDNCSENGICEKCGPSKKVSPGKSSCIEKCPENSTENSNACVCNSGYGPDSAGTGCVTVSTNLSTGAIAGISVAAIVVVGGLVGFLCWWFICRGKA
ncbi:VSP [Giardia lamblia P15]|uniref:VSP n=1 Tax=Giardia intestinalis (strain P15) TaxID=658858 RepID=E1EW20_GIAIA|nr:VSP [Giardia lamblia P15]